LVGGWGGWGGRTWWATAARMAASFSPLDLGVYPGRTAPAPPPPLPLTLYVIALSHKHCLGVERPCVLPRKTILSIHRSAEATRTTAGRAARKRGNETARQRGGGGNGGGESAGGGGGAGTCRGWSGGRRPWRRRGRARSGSPAGTRACSTRTGPGRAGPGRARRQWTPVVRMAGPPLWPPHAAYRPCVRPVEAL
jgi:hypothetical protein